MNVININKGGRLVIACPAPCVLYNVTDNANQLTALMNAREHRKRIIKNCAKNILKGQNKISNQIYKQIFELAEPEIMSVQEFLNHQAEYMQTNIELREITKKEYTEALTLLLPVNVHIINKCFMFTLTELLSDTTARQYAEHNEHYYTKLVNILDRSTWIYNDL